MKVFKYIKIPFCLFNFISPLFIIFLSVKSIFPDLQQDFTAVKEIIDTNHLPFSVLEICDTNNGRVVSLDLYTPTSDYKISIIPSSLGVLDSLRRLSVMGNLNIGYLPKEIGNLKELNYYRLPSLYLNLNSGYPVEFFNCVKMEYLYLDGTNVNGESFNEGFRKFKKLRVLSLRYCGIRILPTWIGEFDSLRVLDCYWNPYLKVPNELYNCKKLQKLNFAYCLNKPLPAEIGNFTEMDTLILTQCSLKTLPVEIVNLKSIKYLDLSVNQIYPDSLTPEVKTWADKFDPDWKETQYYPNEINKFSVAFLGTKKNIEFSTNLALKIDMNSDANIILKILDTRGRVINNNPSLHLRAGTNQISLPNQLGSGVYFITVVKGKEIFTERLVISK